VEHGNSGVPRLLYVSRGASLARCGTIKAARDGGDGDGAHFTFVSPSNPDLLWLREHATVPK
jgi:hypothetical protein